MTEKEFVSSRTSAINSGGIKSFPDDFINLNEFDEVALPGKTLVIGQEFFGSYEIISVDGSLILQAENYPKAKFIIYASRLKPLSIKVPKLEKVIKDSVSSYEEYLDGIIKTIEADYKKQFPGSKASGEVTNSILRILNLVRY